MRPVTNVQRLFLTVTFDRAIRWKEAAARMIGASELCVWQDFVKRNQGGEEGAVPVVQMNKGKWKRK